MLIDLEHHELQDTQGGGLWGDLAEWWGEKLTDAVIEWPAEYARLKLQFGTAMAQNILLIGRMT